MTAIATTTGWQSHLRVTLPRVIKSEWIKFWSLRSTWITLVAAVVAFVGIGMLATSLGADGTATPPGQGGPGPGGGQAMDPTSLSLAGTTFAQLILATLGVLLTATEYSTGMIRATLTAVPKRLAVLWAKLTVFVSVVLSISLIASFVTFLGGQAVLESGVSLSDSGVLRAVVGTAVYLTGAGVIGLVLGVLLRATAAAVTTVFGMLFILPGVSGLLMPDSWSDAVSPYLPSNAGSAFTAVTQTADHLNPWAGLAVFAGYLVIAVIGAAVRLKTRDA
ncbi:ABC transporter permease [Actinoplanes capillaceus]|uniref:ABC transporter permease n=1 Tax=Actinoplanes campanulatus TaxID=113559 RepID=A0ABQ3WQ41_9ACTN|nr:ABC transporter permease [Actinoplanes capillaceus]GID48342.1 ABC transporter permease [Actinoplanes capillaceus]